MYPIILTLRDRRAVVAGGGVLAERAVAGLSDAGARVTVVAPQLSPTLARLAASGTVAWEARPFAAADAVGCTVAIAATGDPGIDAAVVALARGAGVLAADVADPERGDFRLPAVHRSGPLTLAVDAAGLAQGFTARVSDELGLTLDARYARAATTLDRLRARAAAVVPPNRRAELAAHFAERDLDDLAGMPPGAIEHEVERALDTISGVVPGTPATLVCASRASALAMWQTRWIMSRLAEHGIASTVLNVTTRGDAIQDRPLAAIGTEGLFVKELELALRDGRADYAVHSCKDLPSTLPPGMTIAAVTEREDPRDAFCSERYAAFEALPPGARVGTSSPRRRAQLAALRPDIRFDDIRGNVDTRLRMLREGAYDAIVLAMAGLNRLGLGAAHVVPFPVDVVIPAVGQGALAVEARSGDPLATRLGALLGAPATHLAVLAERAFLRTLRGGCQAPVGAHAVVADGRLALVAAIAAPDGSAVVRDRRDLPAGGPADAEAAGTELATALLARGGAALLGAAQGTVRPGEPVPGELAGCLFLLPHAGPRPNRIAAALREAGADVVEAAEGRAAAAALDGRTPGVLLLTSPDSVRAIADYLAELRNAGGKPAVAALDPETARAAGACGWPPDVVAPEAGTASFVQAVTRYVLENAT